MELYLKQLQKKKKKTSTAVVKMMGLLHVDI